MKKIKPGMSTLAYLRGLSGSKMARTGLQGIKMYFFFLNQVMYFFNFLKNLQGSIKNRGSKRLLHCYRTPIFFPIKFWHLQQQHVS